MSPSSNLLGLKFFVLWGSLVGEVYLAIDRVQPLKLEDPSTGGDQTDQFPTELDPQEDYVECSGLVIDDATHRDESTTIYRAGNDMRFTDSNNPDAPTLTELRAGVAVSNAYSLVAACFRA